MINYQSPGYYQNEMPWDGSCFHRWINTTFIGSKPVKGYKRKCLLCHKKETWMYADGGWSDGPSQKVEEYYEDEVR